MRPSSRTSSTVTAGKALRSVQVAAADAIFNSEDNVLLAASTASGKTEAAFFPILSQLDEDPSSSVGVLYIAPLKALINDQFGRLTELCEEAEIPVWRWHGDVAQSRKSKLLKHPSGILQITPESLEALLLHKHSHIPALFGDLRFIVIDEIHSLMRADRGGQCLCLIERLSRLASCSPRRIGLSATIGDLELAGRFLGSGSGRDTIIPRIEDAQQRWRLSISHFFVGEGAEEMGETHWTGTSVSLAESNETDVPVQCVSPSPPEPPPMPPPQARTSASATSSSIRVARSASSSATRARRPKASPPRYVAIARPTTSPTVSSSITATSPSAVRESAEDVMRDEELGPDDRHHGHPRTRHRHRSPRARLPDRCPLHGERVLAAHGAYGTARLAAGDVVRHARGPRRAAHHPGRDHPLEAPAGHRTRTTLPRGVAGSSHRDSTACPTACSTTRPWQPLPAGAR